MRVLLSVKIPHEPFNTYVRDGSVGAKLTKILDAIKPEAIYFTEQHGTRGCVMAVDLADPSKVPFFAEPFFLTFNADVHFQVCMTPDELKRAGLAELGKKWAS